MTTLITSSTTDGQMHNNIMAAGSRDRPPMLAPGRYAQWQSRFLRYIDTRPNGECILEGPYQLTTVTILAVLAIDDSLAVPERIAVETLLNMSPENKEHYQSEKEAIHLLLTGIGDEIYSIVDACKIAHDIWIAIERLQQDTVSYHKLFDVLKQYQKEVNEIRAERIAKNANLLALVAAAQQFPYPYYPAPKSHKSYAPPSKQTSSTRSNASTKFKGKEIAKPITPLSEFASEEDSDPEQVQRDKDMQKNLALIAKYFKKLYKPTNNNLRTSSNSRNKNVDTTSRYKNDNQTGKFGNQRTITVARARETVGSQRQHSEQSEAISNTCVVEKVDSNVIPDSPDMYDNDIQTDQNAEDERAALANLIANLTLDTEENKKILKQLKKANASLTQVLKECKSNLEESNTTRDSCLIALQNKQTKLEKYTTINDRTVDYDKLKRKLNDTLGLLAQKEIDIKEGLKLKAYEILVVKEKHDELVPDREETLTLEKESRSKLNTDLVKPYDYTKQNSLYENFKPASKEYHDQLAHANEVRKKMWRKSFVKTKPKFFKNIGFLPNSKSISKSRQAYNVMTNNINHFRELVDQAWEKHSHDHFRAPTAHDMEILIKTCLMPLALKTQNDSFTFVHELKQEMHADLKYVESLEKEIDELESDKAEFSNMYDILLQECVSNDVMCSYLHSLSDLDAHAELQCLYVHKVKECECLAQKLSKQTETVSEEVYNELSRSFAKLEKHLISLKLALQHCKEQMKNDKVCNETTSNVFQKEREQYHEIQDLKAQLQDKNIAISELNKLIKKCKGKYVETKIDKPSVVRQPNA
ncbi:hypothetical protein Tco_1252250 [Tanacetum coccineum]